MSKLSLKTLERNNLPYGKFSFMVLLKRTAHRPYIAGTNAGIVESMRDLLRNTCAGDYKLVWEKNCHDKRVYTELYLTNAMDLAMVKLVHGEKLHKIYKIKIPARPE